MLSPELMPLFKLLGVAAILAGIIWALYVGARDEAGDCNYCQGADKPCDGYCETWLRDG